MLEPGSNAPAVAGNQFSQEKVLLVFFKVSCPTCQLTLPFLDRLHRSGRLAVHGVSQDGPASTGAFAKAFGLTFPMLFDRADTRYPASNAFGITSVPSLFLVDRDRRIEWTLEGFAKKKLEELGAAFDVPLFRAGDRMPEFKPG